MQIKLLLLSEYRKENTFRVAVVEKHNLSIVLFQFDWLSLRKNMSLLHKKRYVNIAILLRKKCTEDF